MACGFSWVRLAVLLGSDCPLMARMNWPTALLECGGLETSVSAREFPGIVGWIKYWCGLQAWWLMGLVWKMGRRRGWDVSGKRLSFRGRGEWTQCRAVGQAAQVLAWLCVLSGCIHKHEQRWTAKAEVWWWVMSELAGGIGGKLE